MQKNSYGNYVTVKSVIGGNVVYFKYNHLNSVGSNIENGTQVAQGSLLGKTGNTGNAAAKGVVPHIHIQGRDDESNRIDPEPYMATTFNHQNGNGTSPCN